MEVIYLAVALCFNLACTDQQIYIDDVFPPGHWQDCEERAELRAALLQDVDAADYRIGCRTQTQLEREGV